MCEKPFFENLGGHHCRHFAKKEFSKVKHVKLFLVKLTSILGQDITTEKKQHSSIYEGFIVNIFLNKILRKKLMNNLARF